MKAFDAIQLTSGWEVSKYPADIPDHYIPDSSGLDFIPAVVPGAVQYDLISAGKLENPYRSTKAAFDSSWVAKSDWL